ncbi:MAG: hypothetical protein A3F17_03075 [Gammaproteobacteria bacterium RIFCSPHIGHO2_12_FULL_41_15]|nr:MAG: hypothetical protein A3F17_03075 [Gammaproteobacteria bacterium RIFCSPHIGHO2_12_FULL_41_15]
MSRYYKYKLIKQHAKLRKHIDRFRAKLLSKPPLLEALIAVPLGIPDGITYGHFGLIAGLIVGADIGVAGSWSTFIEYFVGLSAALGVTFFAINNVSREFRNWQRTGQQLQNWSDSIIPKKKYGYKKINSVMINFPATRIGLRFTALFIAFISAIPFSGMSLNATVGFSRVAAFIVITANSIARCMMNDYALSNLINKIFNGYINRHNQHKQVLLARIDAFKRKIYKLSDDDPLLYAPNAEFSKRILTRIEMTPPLQIPQTLSRKIMRIASQTLGFIAGAFTATYIFGFARDAVHALGIHSSILVNAIAIAGVLPTAALWGDDTMTIFKRVFQVIYSKIVPDARKTVMPVTPTEYPVLRRWLKLILFLSLAVCGTFSETKMAFDFSFAEPQSWYTHLLRLFSPFAFIAIYGISVLELTDKAVSLIDKRSKGIVAKKIYLFEMVDEIEKNIAEMDQ